MEKYRQRIQSKIHKNAKTQYFKSISLQEPSKFPKIKKP